jgi:L-rhamnose isomerase/sugar isomerase
MTTRRTLKDKLQAIEIGTPSWGYADSGTRFHVWRRPYTARNVMEKIEDAAQVHEFTGICPYLDLHTAWDASSDWEGVRKFARSRGLKIGAVNPHLFAEDDSTLGTIAHPNPRVREKALRKLKDGIEIARQVRAGALSLWFPDGTDFPGQDSFRGRKQRIETALASVYAALPASMSLLLEYKLFEPAFYHTDFADWGNALVATTRLGNRAKVLVDLGHHALGTNIEHIVAVLLSENKLGGFHFNDKKYGDDDLTVGSINPYQLFLILCELVQADHDAGTRACVRNVRLMIDQNHNIKNPIEGTIQSAIAIQAAYAKALLVDYAALARAQANADVTAAEECLKAAFATDVRPLLAEIRTDSGLDPDPLQAFRRSGYTAAAQKRRAASPTGQE